MSLLAFTPNTSTALTVTSVQNTIQVLGQGHYMRVVNGGPGMAWIAFHESATGPTLTTSTGMAIPAGAIEVFSIASDTTKLTALAGDVAAAATLYLTRGEGQ